jgi:hypothetical protein
MSPSNGRRETQKFIILSVEDKVDFVQGGVLFRVFRSRIWGLRFRGFGDITFTRTRKKSLLSCGLLFTTKLQTQHTCNKVHTKSNSISLLKGLELLPILQSHKCTNNVGIQVQQKITL